MSLLVVDANRTDLHSMAKALGPLGHPITLLSSPAEAVTAARSEEAELVVLGLGVADGDRAGAWVSKLRADPSEFRPLLLTVPGSAAELQAGAVGQSADDILCKPIDQALLASRVGSWLRIKHRMDSLRRERDRLEKALATQRELAEFFVHDVRNPLTVVQYNLSYVKAELNQANGETSDALHEAIDAARRIEHYADNLLTIAQGDECGIRLSKQRFGLKEDVRKLLRDFRREAEVREVNLEEDVPRGIELCADRALMLRVCENLLRNALRHSVGGGRVLVSAAEVGSWVELLVANTGFVIPNVQRGAIFERFKRGDNPSGERGAGLGLYFCRRVIEAHGGQIGVEDRQGWSTCFVVRLPAQRASKAFAEADSGCPAGPRVGVS